MVQTFPWTCSSMFLMKRFQLNKRTNFEIQVIIYVFFSHPFSNMFDCWDKIAGIFSNNKIKSNFLGAFWTTLCGVLESKTTYLQKASDFEKITKLKWSWSFFSYFFRFLYEKKTLEITIRIQKLRYKFSSSAYQMILLPALCPLVCK